MSLLINHEFLDRFRGQHGLLNHLAQLYLDTTPETIRRIESAAKSGNTTKIAFNAHSLKGSSAEMGAEQLSKLCQQLQQLAQEGDLNSIQKLVKKVRNNYQETCLALESVIEDMAVAS